MIKRIALLAVMIVMSLSTPSLAAGEGTGTIQGSAVNGTAGGSSVANLNVDLITYINDNDLGTVTTRTDAEGHFTFEGMSAEPSYSYQVKIVYQQAEYYSEMVIFEAGETTRATEIFVYDATTNDEAISLMMSHMIIYTGEDSLLVKEYYIFVNNSDRTYIGTEAEGGMETLRFTMPDKATGLQPTLGLMDCCIQSITNGFIDTMPIMPEGKEVGYSYNIGIESGKCELSRIVNYAMPRFDLLIQSADIKVASDQLNNDEPLDIQGTKFNHLSAENLAQGDMLVIRLSSLPKTGSQAAIPWVATAFGVLALGFGFAHLRKRRKVQPVMIEPGPDQMNQRLLLELAQLDDDFEKGKISEETYASQRTAKKGHLVELMKNKGGV